MHVTLRTAGGVVAVMAVAVTLSAGQINFPDGAPVPREGGGGGAGSDVDDSIFFPTEKPLPEVSCTSYAGVQGTCRLLVQCATFFAEIAELSRSPCTIQEGQQGVCCPPTKRPSQDVGGLISKLPGDEPFVPVPELQLPEINHACEKGIQELNQQEIFEEELLKKNIIAKKGSPVALHAMLFQTRNDIVQQSKDAMKSVAASVNLVKEFNLTKAQGEFGLPRFGIQNTVIADTCRKEPLCPDTKYRAFDATCNNRRNKDWGRAGTAFQRILLPDYDDGVSVPREKSVSGGPLPSARAISSEIILDRHSIYDNFTLMIMQWGQFLDHDITHTPITKGKNMSDITCCKDGKPRPPDETHPACYAIKIPENDPFFKQFGQVCMEFVRSLPAMRPKCNFGPREQMNQITSFIDASNVYGSTLEEANELRTFSGGQLKVDTQGRSLLPPKPSECANRAKQEFCFLAGDSRVNEQPELTVLHTIWMRQHNKLATELARLNSGWNDEVLYQEARRILAAQMQHITYNEYLPIVLGRNFMETFGLVPLKTGYASNYREDVDPSINNAFATAAFRYGHTLIAGHMKTYSRFGVEEDRLRLSKNQFSPFYLYRRDGLDALLRGLSIQASQKFDRFFTEELTNHLFAGNNRFGMDLVALNIQRGRDHGIPSYNKWRQICSLPYARSFEDLRDVMDQDVIAQLKTLYRHVDDIDLFIGGIAETPTVGSLLGYTFLCIVGDQFARLRLGDRFYYENGGLESSFSEAQLEQIRKTSLGRIMCDNSDNLEMMQPLAFVQAHLANMRALCKVGDLIPKMSLQPWRNEPVWVK